MQTHVEFEKIRDFLIAHYHITDRNDSPFWQYCRSMDIPESLKHKIDLFKQTGKIFRDGYEMFSETSWFEVMFGQGLRPESYHPLADLAVENKLTERLNKIRNVIRTSVDLMPAHEDFIADNCAAQKV